MTHKEIDRQIADLKKQVKGINNSLGVLYKKRLEQKILEDTIAGKDVCHSCGSNHEVWYTSGGKDKCYLCKTAGRAHN